MKFFDALFILGFIFSSGAQAQSPSGSYFRCSGIRGDKNSANMAYTGFYFLFPIQAQGVGEKTFYVPTGDLVFCQGRKLIGKIDKDHVHLKGTLVDITPAADPQTEDDRSTSGLLLDLHAQDQFRQTVRFVGNTLTLRDDAAYAVAHLNFMVKGNLVHKDINAECGVSSDLF